MAERRSRIHGGEEPTLRLVTLLHDWSAAPRPLAAFQSELGWTRADCAEELENLREQGYAIEEHPYLGLRLVAPPAHLHRAEVAFATGSRRVGRRIQLIGRVGSTQEAAWQAATKEGGADGLAILAREQTNGRGSRGHTWYSPADCGLYLSVVLEPFHPLPAPVLLTLGAALAVADALASTVNIHPSIDWPNDLVIHGRKIAGILVESRNLHGTSPTLVVGVGVNLRTPPGGWPGALARKAVAIDEVTESEPSPSAVTRSILGELDAVWSLLLRGRHAEIRDRWCARSALLGRQCRLQLADRTLRGCLRVITPTLELGLETRAGTLRRIPAAHVRSLRRAP